jgi:hypothetical protein
MNSIIAVLPSCTLAGTASGSIQKLTQEQKTIKPHGT